MSIYDILMLTVLVGSILFGLWKGLAWQVASLAAIFVSYFVALNFRGPLSGYISASEPWNRFAAMLILFLGTSLTIWMAYGFMKKTIERLRLRGFDAQAGGLLGALKGVTLCMLITLFAVTLFGENVRDSIIASRSGGYIAAAINRFTAMVPTEIHAYLDEHVKKFNQNLDEHSPGFLQQSDHKLEEKLQTIRGKFQVPTNDTGSNLDYQYGSQPNSGGFGNQNPVATGQGGGSGAPSNLRTVGDEVLDTAKELGKQFIDDNFNR